MTTHYDKDLHTLLKDLISTGYIIIAVEEVPGPGNQIRINLRKAPSVFWDRKTKSLWAMGTPKADVDKLESLLNHLYSDSRFKTLWVRKHEFIISNFVAVFLTALSLFAGYYLTHK